MTDTIEDLRIDLFATLRALRDKEAPLDIERAEAVAHVAQTIINSAKVEIDHMKVTGGFGQSKFLALESPAPVPGTRPAVMQTPTGTAHATQTGVVHRMK